MIYDIWYFLTVIVYANVPASYLKCNPSAYTAVLSEQLYSLEVSFSDPIKWYFCVCECGSLKISRFKYLYLYFMRIQTVFENSIWTDPTQFFELIPLNSFGTYTSAWQLKPVSAIWTVPCLFVLLSSWIHCRFAKLNPFVSTLHCGHDVGHFVVETFQCDFVRNEASEIHWYKLFF